MVDDLRVCGSKVGPNRPAKSSCRLFKNSKVLNASYPSAACNYNICLFDRKRHRIYPYQTGRPNGAFIRIQPGRYPGHLDLMSEMKILYLQRAGPERRYLWLDAR